jgi:hypothetical protein
MNRYDITNQRNSNAFSYDGTSFPPPAGYQPEWGKRARTILKSQCDDWELVRATNERPSPTNPDVLIVDLPDDFAVVTTDITQAQADAATLTAAQEARLAQLGTLKVTDIPDLATAKQLLVVLSRAVHWLAKNN